MNHLMRLSVIAAALTMLAGCVGVPAPLAGDYPELRPDQVDDRDIGARVRWGGTIVDTHPGREETCIEVLARDLGRNLQPVAGDRTHGRFLACRDGFQDPATFTEGRGMTIIGRLQGFTTGTIGEFEYQYPQVAADTLHLWPKQPEVIYAEDYRRGPFYDPWWPYYRPWFYPHYSARLIIRP